MTTVRLILLFILLLIPTAASGERPALITAAQSGDVATVKKLLDAGADVEARAKNGRTALHMAADKGHLKIVKVLLEAGADAAARDMMGQTPRDVATRKAIIRVLDQTTSP